jgi:hypothetical protein
MACFLFFNLGFCSGGGGPAGPTPPAAAAGSEARAAAARLPVPAAGAALRL